MPFSRMSIVTATYWLTVFHFARREAGTTTPWPADTARSPVTASSRPMMTTTTHAAILSIVSSDTRAAATISLSAMGSSNVPSVVTWLRRRATTPSSQSVRAAAMKMAAAMSAWTRDEEMRKRISSGTATIRVIVSPIGRFTLGPRSPDEWPRTLSACAHDLVNVAAILRPARAGVEREAGRHVTTAPDRRQVARPRGVLRQPPDVLAVRPRDAERALRLGRRRRRGIPGGEPLDQHPRADVVLERARAALARAQQQHVAAAGESPRGGCRVVDEGGDAHGGRRTRRDEGPRAVAGGHHDRATADAAARELEGRVAEVEAGQRLASPL